MSRRLVFLKAGLGIGGASQADISMAIHLAQQDIDVHLLTGYLDNRIRRQLVDNRIAFSLLPCLDFRRQRPAAEMLAAIRAALNPEDVVVASQAFCPKEGELGAAIAQLSWTHATFVRQHNHLGRQQEESFAGVNLRTTVLPVTGAIAAEVRRLRPDLGSMVLPPLIDLARFACHGADATEARRHVRDRLGLGAGDVLVFQPSRVDRRKGIGYSLFLALELAHRLAGRSVHLAIAGGQEESRESQEAESWLRRTAHRAGFADLHLIDGAFGSARGRRIGDHILAADLVAFPTLKESFGLGVAESALCHRPIVTRRFRDERDYPIYDMVYAGYDTIIEEGHRIWPSEPVLRHAVRRLGDPRRYLAGLNRNARAAGALTLQGSADLTGLRRLLERRGVAPAR